MLKRNSTSRAHQPGELGNFFALISMKSPNFCQKKQVLVALVQSVFFIFFLPIIILFLQYSHKMSSHVLEIRPIKGLMFNILFQTR
jgi:membrane protein YdbS with pleckstrin-like domain